MTDEVPVQSRLRERAAEEVRALLARRMMTGGDLAAAIGKSPMYVSRRVRGEVAFDLDDIERIAGVLKVDVGDLLPRTVSAIKEPYGDLGSSVTPVRRKGRARRHVDTVPRPVGSHRRDSTRPVSAIPANRRRPAIVGMSKRPIAGE